MQYIIDQIIVSIFLNKDSESNEVIEYLVKYTAKVNKIVMDILEKFLKEEMDLTDEQIKAEIDNLVHLFNGGEARPPEYIHPDVLDQIGLAVEGFNERIYKYYDATMTNEQKKMANDYIQSKMQEADKKMQEMEEMINKQLTAYEEEYNRTGKIDEFEKAKVVLEEPVLGGNNIQ